MDVWVSQGGGDQLMVPATFRTISDIGIFEVRVRFLTQ